ncbi:unnamed protein product [Mycena citricolor]|uniref:Uncharacterized protein n=1 Tax=Mycena citricolor TaxID=2018698 RepID=A0AAD2K4Q3_9AGAR|nr:unnamed protein product [Mycena citricolor]
MATCLSASQSVTFHWAPLHPTTATWNTRAALEPLAQYKPVCGSFSSPISFAPTPAPTPKPKLRLSGPDLPPHATPTIRFDPFADDGDELSLVGSVSPRTPLKTRSCATTPSSRVVRSSSAAEATASGWSQNTRPRERGRSPCPLILSTAPAAQRRRSPCFTPPCRSPFSSPASLTWAFSSTGSGAGSPAPSLARPPPPSYTLPSPPRPSALSSAAAAVPRRPHTPPAPSPSRPAAPSPYLARTYPTSEDRVRLLARTLLTRINAVGRPRSVYAALSAGSEGECGKAYTPSRLSECVIA